MDFHSTEKNLRPGDNFCWTSSAILSFYRNVILNRENNPNTLSFLEPSTVRSLDAREKIWAPKIEKFSVTWTWSVETSVEEFQVWITEQSNFEYWTQK